MFAYNWITATMAQGLGHLIATVIFLQSYTGRIPTPALMVHIINFNSGIIVSSFLYYTFERQSRYVAFLRWNIEKELEAWQKLVNVLPVGLLIADRDSVIYANKACIRTSLSPSNVGYDELRQYQGLLGRALKTIVRPMAKEGREDSSPCRELTLHDELFGRREPALAVLRGERFEFRKPGQKPVPLAVNTIEFKRGKDRYKICSLADQSVYEELEAERMQVQCQKSFCAMFTHELRNPLHGILGILESLETPLISPRKRCACKMGINTGRMMMFMINDILDLSRIEVNKFSLAVTAFSPADMVAECIELMHFQYEKKGVALRSVLHKNVPAAVFNDCNRYKQVVLNLLGNALKFTAHGYVEVKVNYDLPDHKLVTGVKDTGTGITKEDQAKLFTMYGKLESSASSNPSGTTLFVNRRRRGTGPPHMQAPYRRDGRVDSPALRAGKGEQVQIHRRQPHPGQGRPALDDLRCHLRRG
ncbi:MAG: HAMP domain-containing sensor histidine kinase [Candidatus Pacebacteria bacterium]|nr:HAMP domain-containing sensor histidine kinase [Candidatus Paceibacterota bacterium]